MKRAMLIAAILATCTMAVNLSFAKNIELEEAISHFNNGRFQKAVNLLERLLTTKTLAQEDYLEANEYLAVAYLSKDETDKASTVFTSILEKSPDYRPNDQWWPHQRLMSVYFTTLKSMGQSLNVSDEGSGLQTIAIMDLENNSVENADKYANLGKALSKIVIKDFSVLSNLKVVERERIQYILDELELTSKKVGDQNIVDAAAAPRIGKLLGAHVFVFGSFIQVGKTFRIDARLVKTETSEIINTFAVEGKPDKLFELAKKLTLEISKGLEVEVKKAERKELDKLAEHDIPIEAVALFGDAMSKANQEEYRAALESLEKAVSAAPKFQKALEMIDVLKPLALAKS